MNRKIEKKNSGWTQYFFILIVCCGVFLVASRGRAAPAADTAIVIKSTSWEGDYQAKVITFVGDVDARWDDLIMRCQRLLAYLGEQPKVKSTEKNSFKIDKIIAKNNVVVTRQTDGLTMHCEEAIYYQNEEKIEATGNPVVIKQGRNVTEGGKFTLFLKTNRIVGEGPTKSTIFKPSS